MRFIITTTLILALSAPAATAESRAHDTRALKHASTNLHVRTGFDVVGLLTYRHQGQGGSFFIEQDGVAVHVKNASTVRSESLKRGDLVRATGFVDPAPTLFIPITCTNLSILARSQSVSPTNVRMRELQQSAFLDRFVQIEGDVVDARVDHIHSQWATLLLSDEQQHVYVAVEGTPNRGFDFTDLIGARISAKGVRQLPYVSEKRRTITYSLTVESMADVRVLAPAAGTSRSTYADIGTFDFMNSAHTATDDRRQAVGRVVARWGRDNVLLRTADGLTVKGELSQQALPPVDATIRLVGYPETDLCIPILIRAFWDPVPDGASAPPARAVTVTADELRTDDYGEWQYNFTHYGDLVRLTGCIRGTSARKEDGVFYLESDGRIVTLDVSTTPAAIARLRIGDRIEAVGICIIDAEKASPHRVFPRINGYRIVVRSPDDIRVLSVPSWWTPGRLISTIALLVSLLFGILVWNAALRRVAARKGRELMQEQLEHVKAELKTEERTRLAVELHDSLAQNLTGVSLEIDTAAKVADEDPVLMKSHLGIAARSLKSCRDELRNCLWDLRNRALEARTMDEAIRQTLAPHAAGVAIAVRFNVPRERISDNTAHTILRIVRELALNGIRHGGATRIWIAGKIDGGQMLFSVRDNGCGFDPYAAPGFSEGHYGLLGIQERIDEFEGEFTLKSAPNKGTKATVSLKVPQET